MREHPEGGWRNPLWRAMAILDIVVSLALVVAIVGLVVFVVVKL